MDTQPTDAQPASHRCGLCGDEWLSEVEYLAHVCPQTNVQPTDPAHQGPEFAAVQQAALQRGLDNLAAEGADTSTQQAAIEQHAADNGLALPAADAPQQ